jgi:hypothetical protein
MESRFVPNGSRHPDLPSGNPLTRAPVSHRVMLQPPTGSLPEGPTMPADHLPVNGAGGNGSRSYLCSICRTFISSSDRLVKVNDSNFHSFTNPDGVECDFNTFLSCPGAVAHGRATAEYTWFTGYLWRFAVCGTCHQHLGWHYAAQSPLHRPLEFWGLLVSRLASV